MVVIVDVGDPMEDLLDDMTAQDAPFTTLLRRTEGAEFLYFLPNRGQIAILEGDKLTVRLF